MDSYALPGPVNFAPWMVGQRVVELAAEEERHRAQMSLKASRINGTDAAEKPFSLSSGPL